MANMTSEEIRRATREAIPEGYTLHLLYHPVLHHDHGSAAHVVKSIRTQISKSRAATPGIEFTVQYCDLALGDRAWHSSSASNALNNGLRNNDDIAGRLDIGSSKKGPIYRVLMKLPALKDDIARRVSQIVCGDRLLWTRCQGSKTTYDLYTVESAGSGAVNGGINLGWTTAQGVRRRERYSIAEIERELRANGLRILMVGMAVPISNVSATDFLGNSIPADGVKAAIPAAAPTPKATEPTATVTEDDAEDIICDLEGGDRLLWRVKGSSKYTHELYAVDDCIDNKDRIPISWEDPRGSDGKRSTSKQLRGALVARLTNGDITVVWNGNPVPSKHSATTNYMGNTNKCDVKAECTGATTGRMSSTNHPVQTAAADIHKVLAANSLKESMLESDRKIFDDINETLTSTDTTKETDTMKEMSIETLTTKIKAAREIQAKAIEVATKEGRAAALKLMGDTYDSGKYEAKATVPVINRGVKPLAAYDQALEELSLLAGDTVDSNALGFDALDLIRKAGEVGVYTSTISVYLS